MESKADVVRKVEWHKPLTRLKYFSQVNSFADKSELSTFRKYRNRLKNFTHALFAIRTWFAPLYETEQSRFNTVSKKFLVTEMVISGALFIAGVAIMFTFGFTSLSTLGFLGCFRACNIHFDLAVAGLDRVSHMNVIVKDSTTQLDASEYLRDPVEFFQERDLVGRYAVSYGLKWGEETLIGSVNHHGIFRWPNQSGFMPSQDTQAQSTESPSLKEPQSPNPSTANGNDEDPGNPYLGPFPHDKSFLPNPGQNFALGAPVDLTPSSSLPKRGSTLLAP